MYRIARCENAGDPFADQPVGTSMVYHGFTCECLDDDGEVAQVGTRNGDIGATLLVHLQLTPQNVAQIGRFSMLQLIQT